mmetsp:Transcript_38708/g.28062  ORF Transcript_38708/g.28062 Transcript_38708/m.28062 type:complete len:133 (-) Transcript_38708:1629-2027(-)
MSILVPGCGNSNLSEKLHSSLGFSNILSTDFEPEIIQKMNERGVKGLKYEVSDSTNMKDQYTDNSFTTIIDKGTFDAICIDATKETKEKCNKYLNELVRVSMAKGGQIIIVSLLQDFVLNNLIEFFVRGQSN